MLMQERKPLPAGWRIRARLKPKRGHSEQQPVNGRLGSSFPRKRESRDFRD